MAFSGPSLQGNPSPSHTARHWVQSWLCSSSLEMPVARTELLEKSGGWTSIPVKDSHQERAVTSRGLNIWELKYLHGHRLTWTTKWIWNTSNHFSWVKTDLVLIVAQSCLSDDTAATGHCKRGNNMQGRRSSCQKRVTEYWPKHWKDINLQVTETGSALTLLIKPTLCTDPHLKDKQLFFFNSPASVHFCNSIRV